MNHLPFPEPFKTSNHTIYLFIRFRGWCVFAHHGAKLEGQEAKSFDSGIVVKITVDMYGEAKSGSNIVNAASLVVTDVEFWHTDGV